MVEHEQPFRPRDVNGIYPGVPLRGNPRLLTVEAFGLKVRRLFDRLCSLYSLHSPTSVCPDCGSALKEK